MSEFDLASLRGFLAQTPEGALRKMLVDGKPMTEVHLNLLLKVVRACNDDQFAAHFEKNDFPKIKMGAAEIKIREKFWGECTQTLKSRGLLYPAPKSKVAA